MKIYLALLTLLSLTVHAEAPIDTAAKLLATEASAGIEAETLSTDDVVTYTVNYKTTKITFTSDTTTLFQKIDVLAPPKELVSQGVHYLVGWQSLTPIGSHGAIYSFASDVKQAQYSKSDYPNGDYPSTGGSVAMAYKPLSIVGPYVSYLVQGYSYFPGAAHPNDLDEIVAIDASSYDEGASQYNVPNLLNLVDEASLVAALKADKFLQTHFAKTPEQKKALAAAKTYPDVYAAVSATLDESCYYLPGYDGDVSAFAIYDYDVAKNRVAIRLPITPAAHVCEGQTTYQLGLWVQPKPAFQKMLIDQKQTKSGLFMIDAH